MSFERNPFILCAQQEALELLFSLRFSPRFNNTHSLLRQKATKNSAFLEQSALFGEKTRDPENDMFRMKDTHNNNRFRIKSNGEMFEEFFPQNKKQLQLSSRINEEPHKRPSSDGIHSSVSRVVRRIV